MLFKKFRSVPPQYIFIGLIVVIYTVLFFVADQLHGPPWADEQSFYETSQQFSHQLIPSLDQLKNYSELNTPLPFIIYGQIEYLFHGGLFAGRLFSYLISISIAIYIGWPGQGKHRFTPILALTGFFLHPYFLWFSTRYYTQGHFILKEG